MNRSILFDITKRKKAEEAFLELGIAQDITEHNQMEEAIRQSEERYRTIIDEIDVGYYEMDPAGNFTFVNDSMSRILGYSRKELIGMNYRLFTPEGEVKGTDEIFNKVYRTGEPLKWVPLTNIRKNGTLIFVEDSIFTLRNKEGKIIGFRGISRDITERKKGEEESKQSLNKVHRALEGVIQAMALTIETRDPFTAIHQSRVADLARSIGQEMGLTKDTVETIHMAGMVHDLGMISIPLEILSNPAQLSSLEFGLIRVHPQIGYKILKDIDFPWPIAKIVYQHHERINGSGYPMGLKDGEILPEAKVLMVADVVEAIASHRPYRPAQGIDVALKKISMNGGIIYDPGVVNTCLRLFKEKGFTLK
jgi:PAS domain S-box-containing protein